MPDVAGVNRRRLGGGIFSQLIQSTNNYASCEFAPAASSAGRRSASRSDDDYNHDLDRNS
ncbi:MAG: hypothetical protein WBD82_01465 [Acidimicrobiales bacterium]